MRYGEREDTNEKTHETSAGRSLRLRPGKNKVKAKPRKKKRGTVSGACRRKRRDGQGRMGDAWALGGEEGRDKLRKAAGRGKCPLIRGYPNGATRRERSRHPG